MELWSLKLDEGNYGTVNETRVWWVTQKTGYNTAGKFH